MAPPKTSDMQLFFLHLLFFSFSLSSASDFITPSKTLSGAQKLTSDGGQFELGFFQPGKSPYYYIGIWYSLNRVSQLTPVWVANRKTPLADHSKAELKISYDGNLILSSQTNPLIWSTNITTKSNSTIAVLLDSGNLVLRDGSDPNSTLWQSFDHPTHVWLPGGKLGMNKITGEIQHLTSWRSEDDPAPGLFSLGIDPNGTSYSILRNNSFNYWTSGVWDDRMHRFSFIPEMTLTYIYDFDYVSNDKENYFIYSVKTHYSLITLSIMGVSGQIQQLTWVNNTEWIQFWAQPKQQCQVHALCGPFGSCNEKTLPFCNCIEGFGQKSPSDWALSDWSGGCVRKTQLQCGTNSSNQGEKDRFLTLPNMKLPDNVNPQFSGAGSDSDCQLACLNNCSCTAYSYTAYSSDTGSCSHWYGELLDLQDQYGGSGAGTIFLRLAASELPNSKSNKGVVIWAVVGGVVGFLALVVAVWLLIWWRRRKGMMGKSKVVVGDLQRVTRNSSGKYDYRRRRNDLDVPLFDFRTIASATKYFSDVNKIGHGGFGSVYKGNLGEGQEVAIKRLAKTSLQGVEEFKNEVMLIAKLQHKNHVRLMGCCIQGEERILIYEYMPNGSLDAFLFDEDKGALLDWKTRYQIIIGITRGLLYLHHDSRFRIIHRDLKASNILLDNTMNPKISDFGMARIFGGDETAGFNTRKVVGTYGYMSPEYAMGGIFSVKSDVFSFGVLLLEIISGRKNRGEYTFSPHLNLLAHAWSLWNEGKSLQLVHQSMGDSFPAEEALKCIKVGLLCVQERPEDRPLMSSVVVMLDNSSDIVTLPMPKQPGFIACTTPSELDVPSNNQESSTSNGLTVSLHGR